MHYKREIKYHDNTNCNILSAQKCKHIVCLYNISGQIVCITGVE